MMSNGASSRLLDLSSVTGCLSEKYARSVVETARWSETAGCEGMLVYTDNGIADPWLVAQLILQSTDRLAPLIAVQAAYMHPYTVAKMVSTLGYLHKRKLYLNMVAEASATTSWRSPTTRRTTSATSARLSTHRS